MLVAGLILALSVPFGFVIAHVVTPFLWWMEVQTSMAFTGQAGPNLFVISLSILFIWGLLFAATSMVIEHRARQR